MPIPIFSRVYLSMASIALAAFCLAVAVDSVSAQQDLEDKRELQHTDYDKWNSVRGQNLSADGKWISYTVSPGEGDATLKIRHIASTKEYTILRGANARFTYDSKFVVYRVDPDSKLSLIHI